MSYCPCEVQGRFLGATRAFEIYETSPRVGPPALEIRKWPYVFRELAWFPVVKEADQLAKRHWNQLDKRYWFAKAPEAANRERPDCIRHLPEFYGVKIAPRDKEIYEVPQVLVEVSCADNSTLIAHITVSPWRI